MKKRGWQRTVNAALVLALVLPFLQLVFPQPVQAAFANGYTYRRLIDITDAQVSSGPHTNFPVLVSTTLADLKTTTYGGDVTDAGGDDIIFTDSDGTTQLAHEVEKYDATTGELIAWVRVPSLAATSTIYIYYGNASVTTFQGNVTSNGVTGVWDSNYKAVWHLKEDPSGTPPQIKDSTSNARHGTSAGTMTTSDQVAGQVDGSLDFDGSNDRIDTADFMSSGITQVTAQAWVFKAATKDARIVYKNNADNWGAPVFGLASGGTDQIRARVRISDGSGTDYNIGTISLNTWTFVAFTYDGANIRVYKNGVEAGYIAETGTLAATADVVVIAENQAGGGGARAWPGRIDEVRQYA